MHISIVDDEVDNHSSFTVLKGIMRPPPSQPVNPCFYPSSFVVSYEAVEFILPNPMQVLKNILTNPMPMKSVLCFLKFPFCDFFFLDLLVRLDTNITQDNFKRIQISQMLCLGNLVLEGKSHRSISIRISTSRPRSRSYRFRSRFRSILFESLR